MWHWCGSRALNRAGNARYIRFAQMVGSSISVPMRRYCEVLHCRDRRTQRCLTCACKTGPLAIQVKEIAKMGVNMAAKVSLYAVRSVATVSITAVMMIAKESATPGGTDRGDRNRYLALTIVKFREKKGRTQTNPGCGAGRPDATPGRCPSVASGELFREFGR